MQERDYLKPNQTKKSKNEDRIIIMSPLFGQEGFSCLARRHLWSGLCMCTTCRRLGGTRWQFVEAKCQVMNDALSFMWCKMGRAIKAAIGLGHRIVLGWGMIMKDEKESRSLFLRQWWVPLRVFADAEAFFGCKIKIQFFQLPSSLDNFIDIIHIPAHGLWIILTLFLPGQL